MDTDTIIILRTCSGCHTTKIINHFGINNKGTHFKTCDNCRLRNKTKRIKQIQQDLSFNKQTETIDCSPYETIDDSTYETMSLTDKYKIIFF
jgi:hypothetical protein